MRWRWDGDNDAIDGFAMHVYTETETISWEYLEDSAMRSLDIEDYIPACGETFYFEMYAYAGDIRSRMSNIQYWPGDELVNCREFWQREPGVPDALRSKLTRHRTIPVYPAAEDSPAVLAIKAEWEQLKADRLAWLRENGYRQ